MSGISVFGSTGFVGSEFCRVTKRKLHPISREERSPETNDSVYFISTTDNYNVFEDLHKDIDTNLTVLMDVIKNLKPGESTFNFISSWFVYGDADLPATEESTCDPKGFYSITKRAAEQLLISYCQTFGINYRILRLCNVYGAGDKGASKKKNALQFLIDRFKNDEEISLYHNGEFYRDYMHVHDVARAIDLVIEKGELNTIYNIGSGDKVLFKDLINTIVNETSSQSKITPIEPPIFHQTIQVKDFYFNTDKLKSLGFEQSISLEEGIKTLCQ
ncbi:MAG: SDR family oxidoreductase [Bacteriovoracaceae bacterium]|nr:SDR family oxidoreductase [Bacteriovoracaceae bacterium]